MAYKRLIFSLLYYEGSFVLSRNFKRQKVGDWNWLKNKYKLLDALKSLDELVILNVDQTEKGFLEVLEITKELAQLANLPISVGGGINSLAMATQAFNAGADKLIINSLYFQSQSEVKRVAEKFGLQAIVLNIDYRLINGNRYVFTESGSRQEGLLLDQIDSLSLDCFGELLLRNMDKDGTGFGNDIEFIRKHVEISKPLLVAGGTGNSEHVRDAFRLANVDGIVTSNILNFIGSGLVRLRSEVSNEFDLAKW